ncbi:protein FAR-RED ELONGATED HYPOCOTYL 3-like [Corylus avellana]|uniref:protein FAR-RED ELONGATED HYPOCOTYL 3-like n=1 Tax=Corylus avellana TaxID=13451 RepID=UPI00286ADE1E|nr:protein FAR-RED ELONGATED HYPOCOTYL 3-like [Corylus avellana]
MERQLEPSFSLSPKPPAAAIQCTGHHEATAPPPSMAFSRMDSENECEDDNLRTHIRVGDDLPSEIVLENDGNETIRDEDNNNGKGKGKSEWKLVSEDENVEQPQRGMTFSSIDELFSYYRRFSRKRGFGVIIKKITKDKITGKETRVTLACGRQGKPQPTTNRPNPTIKTDCKAKLNAKLVETKWYVTSVISDHNHDLSPNKGRYYKCNRNLNSNVRRKIIVNDISGIGLSQSFNSLAVEAGGYENLHFIEKDCRNFINKERHIRLGQGGAKALLDYLNKMQATDSGFYFAVDSDDDSRLKNVFWIDARSRASFESFGDVVTFDTTYLTNKYGMPFAPFVGVNHHGWQSLLDSYDLKDHDWLRRLYNERAFWVPAYLKGVFWAGMRSTKRSESMNAFFDGYVRPSTTLKQFVDQYDLALWKKVENESLADFKSFNTKLPCVTFYPFEEKFEKVYTITKFKEVQHEIISRIYCTVSLLTKEGAICTYQVTEQVKVQNEVVEDAYVKVVPYVVYFNEDGDEFEVKCTCDSFDSRGILCRHIFALLCAHNITSLPPKYYLDRWRKDVKRRYTLIKCSFDALSANPEVQRYDSLCKGMHTLAEVAARNVDHYTKVWMHIDMLTKELRASSCEPNPPSLALPGVSLTCNESIDNVELAVDGDEVHSPIVAKKR